MQSYVYQRSVINKKPQDPAPPSLSADRLLRVQQVAERLTVSMSTVYGLIDSGALPCVRVSERCVRVLESEVEKYFYGKKESDE